MRSFSKTIGGFTLIEILVSITIIMTISAIGVVTFTRAGAVARDNKRKSDFEVLRQSLVLYKTTEGEYPNDGGVSGAYPYTDLTDDLINGQYLTPPRPYDPQGYEYIYTYANSGGSFCLCVQTEGSSAPNSSDNACSFTAVNPTYYCVVSP